MEPGSPSCDRAPGPLHISGLPVVAVARSSFHRESFSFYQDSEKKLVGMRLRNAGVETITVGGASLRAPQLDVTLADPLARMSGPTCTVTGFPRRISVSWRTREGWRITGFRARRTYLSLRG